MNGQFEDPSDDDQPPFRWNWQAMSMVALTMSALVIPLIGVAWFANGYLASSIPREPVSAKEIDTATLRTGLERMSDAQFATMTTLDEKGGLEIQALPGEFTSRVARILALAREAGGSGLEMISTDEAVKRVMIQVPVSRDELLRRAIGGERIDFSTVPAETQTRMFEVTLKAP